MDGGRKSESGEQTRQITEKVTLDRRQFTLQLFHQLQTRSLTFAFPIGNFFELIK